MPVRLYAALPEQERLELVPDAEPQECSRQGLLITELGRHVDPQADIDQLESAGRADDDRGLSGRAPYLELECALFRDGGRAG
jgi:hypothetical protein